MSVLSRDQIRDALNASPPLLESFLKSEDQLQSNGFDLTIAHVASFTDGGHIGIDNAHRLLPATKLLQFDGDGFIQLETGSYLVTFNEVVHLPKNLMALAKPRSSLLRSGVAVHNAVWDAGYHGRSQALLVVYNRFGFRLAQNARIVQMIFLTLDHPTSQAYSGRFQGENLFYDQT